ncbi:MAG: hypothetical protein KDD35_02885 [Bdellovibrionales bacterium]|nr:hypothetical protein [Bdellovibrionales bacterium]
MNPFNRWGIGILMFALTGFWFLYKPPKKIEKSSSSPILTQNIQPYETKDLEDSPQSSKPPKSTLSLANKEQTPPKLTPPKKISPENSNHQTQDPPLPYQGPMTEVTYKISGDWAIAYGDILLGKLENAGQFKLGRHRPDRPRIWDSHIIPFGIHSDLKQKERVEAAIKYFNENTVIRFVPLEPADADALIFVSDADNCASYLGRIGGMQPIMVADKCGRQELIHEIMHALGFVHEHSRIDRDNYLQVIWDKIDPEYWPQFAQVPDTLVHDYHGSVFDFDSFSAMLYSPTAFAKIPGEITLRARGNLQLSPSRDGLSSVDRERLFYLYGK